jgi:hypothetical protein
MLENTLESPYGGTPRTAPTDAVWEWTSPIRRSNSLYLGGAVLFVSGLALIALGFYLDTLAFQWFVSGNFPSPSLLNLVGGVEYLSFSVGVVLMGIGWLFNQRAWSRALGNARPNAIRAQQTVGAGLLLGGVALVAVSLTPESYQSLALVAGSTAGFSVWIYLVTACMTVVGVVMIAVGWLIHRFATRPYLRAPTG